MKNSSLYLAALALAGACLSVPAQAADDGAAPLWEGIGGILGLMPSDPQDPIDYRAHGKIVLPPKMALPAPAANASANPAWPQDPDILRARKAREAEKTAVFRPPHADSRHSNPDLAALGQTVTMSATAGQGPTPRRCANGLTTANCQPKGGMLSLLGLQNTPDTQLGPEPDRDWLTDPPKGYRAPNDLSPPAPTPAK